MTPIGERVLQACVWEATARKAGNVHRFADFANLTYLDFVLSAGAIAPILDDAPNRPIGEIILDAIRATRRVVSTNTNLGIVLLLTPLAGATVPFTFRATTIDDARNVFEAIRVANPGGMGKVESQDIADEPTLTLREVMGLAADRDLIAKQYVTDFADVFDFGVPALRNAIRKHGRLERAIIELQLEWLAEYPDSLIVRKRGMAEAVEVQRRAASVQRGNTDFDTFDGWLRDAHSKRNPGTTADFVTACLFVVSGIDDLKSIRW